MYLFIYLFRLFVYLFIYSSIASDTKHENAPSAQPVRIFVNKDKVI